VRWLRITLAVAGSLALEGATVQWVADHRRHHAYADRDGDPHSPWLVDQLDLPRVRATPGS
jgi:stearoyl-CoA desaturase (delta-9 desaturase)